MMGRGPPIMFYFKGSLTPLVGPGGLSAPVEGGCRRIDGRLDSVFMGALILLGIGVLPVIAGVGPEGGGLAFRVLYFYFIGVLGALR